MKEESKYIIVPVSDKDGRSRDLYGGGDTAGSSSTKARSIQGLTLTLVPTWGVYFKYSLASDVHSRRNNSTDKERTLGVPLKTEYI